MKISVQILVTFNLVIANLETVTIERNDPFALAISTIIMDFYVKQSSTISITKCSISRLDIEHNRIVDNVLAILDPKILVAWTIKSNYLHPNNSIYLINNVILIDSYISWR